MPGAPFTTFVALTAARAVTPRTIRKTELVELRDQLSGRRDADGILKWIALAWGVAFVPLLLLSFAAEAGLRALGLDGDSAVVRVAQGIVVVPLLACVWYLVRHLLSSGHARPTLLDDLLIVTLAVLAHALGFR